MDADFKQSNIETIDVLGIPVSIVNMTTVVRQVVSWAQNKTPSTVFVREVASLMAAVEDEKLRQLHYSASLVVPDGFPLVWIGRARGLGSKMGRVAGADLVDAVCEASLLTGQSHYFFGGRPGVAEKMVERLKARHEGLIVVGAFSPPMRSINADFEFDGQALDEINAIKKANPDFIWVGISSPKQEYWMMKAMPFLEQGIFLGVGAAFDFHSGAVKRAPRWVRDHGMEWLHRLLSEPRRLWRRYLILAPKFVMLLCANTIRLRRQKAHN